MIQLNGESVQKAWDDYKGFLVGVGVQLDFEGQHRAITRQIEQAFKMGFAMGEASKPEQKNDIVVKVDAITAEKPKKKYKRGKIRTPQQMESEARLVASIMQNNPKAMQLNEIVEAVKKAGVNWHPRSATGHMQRIMERYPTIKKVGFGFYQYEQ